MKKIIVAEQIVPDNFVGYCNKSTIVDLLQYPTL